MKHKETDHLVGKEAKEKTVVYLYERLLKNPERKTAVNAIL